jgi:spermidine/putrescine transport system substrate-binding protein
VYTKARLVRVHFIAVAILLAACGQAPASPEAAAPTVAPAAPEATIVQASEPTVPAAEGSSGSISVLEWAGYEDPELWKPFAAQHPEATVDYSFFADNAEALAKLQSGFSADVIHPCSDYWRLFVDAGLMQPIDTSRLTNWSGVRESLAKEGQFDGQQYFIPWDWGYESILYRTDKVTAPPTSWADLWKPEYAGRVAIQDSGSVAYIMAGLALGIDPWAASEAESAQIRQKLIELKPNLLSYWSDSTSLTQQIAAGDVWVAGNAWSDTYITLKNEGVPVEYITPKEGRLGWLCGFGIPANAQNVDLAYAYIDATLAPASMAHLSNTSGYGAANAEALALTDAALVQAMQLDQPNIIERTVFYKGVSAEQNELFNSMWAEVKAAP